MDPRLWPLIEGEPEDEIAVLARLRPGGAIPPTLRVISRFEDIVSGRTERQNLLVMRQDDQVLSVKAPLEVKPFDRWGRPGLPAWRQARFESANEVTGAGVCIGVIDWGLDFTHPNFLNEDGSTRLLALWDQRSDPATRGLQPYGYGRLFMPGAINDALQSADPFEALGYDHWGADPLDVGTHGTHVADIAAGVGRIGVGGVAPGSDLIFVHLAKHSRGPRSLGNSVTLFEAVDFLTRVVAGRPCVINLSLGGLCGPHDGSSLIEQGLDAAMRQHSNVVIVQSGGNYCRRPVHASGSIATGERHQLQWKIDERDKTQNQLDFWYAGGDRLTLTLVCPTGDIIAVARPGDHGALVWKGTQIGRYGHRLNDPNNGDNQVAFILDARAYGSWQIIIEADEVETGSYDAWIERDDSAAGSQSTLHVPNKRGTTNSISSGMLPIVVGAYDPETRRRADFSSCGPTRDGRPKPDIHAPGRHILAAQSLLRDADEHSITAKTGSSMASPHVAGTVALMIEAAGGRLTPGQIRTALRETARPLPKAVIDECNGWGLLDIDGAVEFVRDRRNLGPAETFAEDDWLQEGEQRDRDPMKGRRIKRATVNDKLGSDILELLWREISETDVPAMEKRLRALIKRTDKDKVDDFAATVLLERLEPGGDLYADFEYRLSTHSRNLIRDRLRKRAKQWVPPPDATASRWNIAVDDPDPGPFQLPMPPVVPPPPPPRVKLPTHKLELVKSWVFKTPPILRLHAAKYFRVLVWGELELSVKFNGTKQDADSIKLNWESPGYQAELKEWKKQTRKIEAEFRAGIVDVKVEVGDDLAISAKHKWSVAGREISLELSNDKDEFLKFEAELFKPSFDMVILGQTLTTEASFKVVAALKWDWRKVVEEFVKDKSRRLFDWLISRLKGALKRYFIGKLFFAAGVGLVLWLLGRGGSGGGRSRSGAKLGSGSPYDAPKGDAVGENAAREINGGQIPARQLEAAIYEDAALNRSAYASAAGGALKELLSARNAQVLADFVNKPQPAESWQDAPPSINDVARTWQVWARTRPTAPRGKRKTEIVSLARDDYRHRLRVAEKALVVGRVLVMRGLIAEPSFALIKGVALQQASIAGFAAAVQLVRQFIRVETYQFISPDGQLVRQDGAVIWNMVGDGINRLGFSPESMIDQAGLYMLHRLGPLRG